MKNLKKISSLMLILGLISCSQPILIIPSASAQVSKSLDPLLFKKLSQSPKLQSIAKNLNGSFSNPISQDVYDQAIKEAETLTQDEVFVVRKLISNPPSSSEYQAIPGMEALRDQIDWRVLEIISKLFGGKNFFALSPAEIRKMGDAVEKDPQILSLNKQVWELRRSRQSRDSGIYSCPSGTFPNGVTRVDLAGTGWVNPITAGFVRNSSSDTTCDYQLGTYRTGITQVASAPGSIQGGCVLTLFGGLGANSTRDRFIIGDTRVAACFIFGSGGVNDLAAALRFR